MGLAAVAGAALAGATTVIAVDVDERKCDAATETFGATHAICAKDMSEDEVIEAVRELTARSAKLHAELLSRWDSLSEQYREALGEITSPEAWAKTFEDNPPVDVQR